jgi:hypothetical protein
MTWIYLLESISKKLNQNLPSPLFFQFFMATVRTTVVTHTVPCLWKKMGGTVSNYLYRDTVAMGIVTSAHPSLLMRSSDGRADVTIPIATDNVRHY